MRGLYIALEGGVGAGKDTIKILLANLIESSFPNIPLLQVREPGTTRVAETLWFLAQGVDYKSEVDLNTEMYLYLAARVSLYSTVIAPNLESGSIVLSARTWPSSYAYQGAAYGFGTERVLQIHQDLFNICFPDYIFYLDLPAEIGLERIALQADQSRALDDKHESNKLNFHETVREAYQELSRHNIFADHPNCWHTINADQPPENVFGDISKLLIPLISTHFDTEIINVDKVD